jgi:AhpD family alkylhydroperoxidase
MHEINLAWMSHSGILSRQDIVANRRKSIMTARLNPAVAAPSLMKLWYDTSVAISRCLDPKLAELVKTRASQINGCAVCTNMHSVFAREHGETEQRIFLLPAWREAPCYTDRERAALGWTEALTRLCEVHEHESAYEALKAEFTEEEQVSLTLAINIINGWNRIAVGFGGWADPAAVKSSATTSAT